MELKNTGWIARAKPPGKPRATWAAVAFAALSLLMQGVDLWRSDLKPLLEETRQNRLVLERLARAIEDHERRISDLEQRQARRTAKTAER